MAGPWYVRSTDGDDGSDGLSWANAKATLTGAFAAASDGDTIYVSDKHAETQASGLVLTSPGTRESPCRVLCVDDSAEPPTALAATATISTTNASAITLSGSAYYYGITFSAGSGSSGLANPFTIGGTNNAINILDACNLTIGNTWGTGTIMLGSLARLAVLKNVTVKFAAAGQNITAYNAVITGLSVDGTGSIPTTLFPCSTGANATSHIIIHGCDLSALGTGTNILSVSGRSHYARLDSCKLGAGVTIVSGTIVDDSIIEVINCDSADPSTAGIRYQKSNALGTLYGETTIVRTGGAANIIGESRKMVSTTYVNFGRPLELGPLAIWNETTGSELTATVEIVTDNVTLTDAECWLEVEYLGTSGYPLSLFASDRAASILATPANQATSSETWTTTGLSTPVKQKLSVSFTPQEKGLVKCRVMLAKASTTVYVCPKIELGATPVSTRQYQGSEYINEPLLPAAEDVENGVQYGAGGTEFTGTLVAGGGYTYGDNDPDYVLTTAVGAGNYVPIADSDTVDGGVSYGVGEEGTGVNATTIRTALGLASANLDTQLAAIVADTNELQAELADGGRTDLLIDGIKAKTDNLPASPAAVGSAMTLTEAYDAAKTAAQAGNAMALTSGERTTLAAAIEAAIINELDGTAVMQAIADLIASDMTTTDLTVAAIASACRDAILNRVLSGNHDTAGTPGKLLQNCDAPISNVPTVDEFNARTVPAASIATSTQTAAILDAVGVVDTVVDAIKAKTDGLNFTGTDVKATLDGEEVTPTAASKTGYALAANGLDSITTTGPAGVAANFREMLVQVWRRFFGKVTMTADTLTTYDDAGTAVATTQTLSDDSTTQTQGKAASA